MTYSNDFLVQQKEKLLAEKQRIENKIAELKKYPDYGTDEEDQLQEMEDYENNISIDSQLEILLKKINMALKAIEDGTYGQCAECKKNIEEGRLSIMPYADLCVTCETQIKK